MIQENHQTVKVNCQQCGGEHTISIDANSLNLEQLAGKQPILQNFICPDTAFMYRVVNFSFDSRIELLKNSNLSESIRKQFQQQWGLHDFDKKIQRFIDLDFYLFGLPEEYYELILSVVSSYCCGNFYPALTSSGALGERILNRLILKTRNHYKHSPHFKKIYKKKSFDNWDEVIPILKEWNIISESVSDNFIKLKKFRNDSIHYNEGYDFESNSKEAVKLIYSIINLQFSYYKRKDLFWVFDVPGEIWLKNEVINNPFVKEFIIPHSVLLTPLCEPPVRATRTPLKPLTDEEFLNIRKQKVN